MGKPSARKITSGTCCCISISMRVPTHCYIYVKMAQQEMMVECKHGSTTKYVLCNCVYQSSSDICTKI